MTTQKTRRIRPTPIGPDGMAYWECKDAEGRWRAIPTASCAQMMWVVAAGGGRGDACYKMSVAGLGDTGGQKVTFGYKVSLKDDGFPHSSASPRERSARYGRRPGSATA